MILEIADISIHPGQNAAFEEALVRGMHSIIEQANGFAGYKLNRCLENPNRYVLQVFWRTLADHTQGFRASPAFAQWRAIVGPFFAAAPLVQHFEMVAKSAGKSI